MNVVNHEPIWDQGGLGGTVCVLDDRDAGTGVCRPGLVVSTMGLA
jgi:hypothetical protein